MITSVPTSETSQNVYSAQSCIKGSDCQTRRNLKGRIFKSILPVERSPIHTPIGAQENTTISAGGCRFIQGPVGSYRCECTNSRHCYKADPGARCTLTPKCFLYHDRHVYLNVKRAIGIEDRLKDSFPDISVFPTQTVLEIGKKENKEVLPKVISLIQEELKKGKRPSTKKVSDFFAQARMEDKIGIIEHEIGECAP